MLNTQVNPAVWEISGHIVLKRREDFEKASEEYVWKLLSEVSLSEDRFEEIKAAVLEASGLQESNPDRTSIPGTKGKEKSSLDACDSTRLLLRDGIVLQ